MFGYPEFPYDVYDSFNELLLPLHFKVEGYDNSSVTYAGKTCKIIIAIEGNVITGFFLEPNTDFEDNKFYVIEDVLDFFSSKNESEIKVDERSREGIRVGLRSLAIRIERECDRVIKDGDFSWVHEFDTFLKKRAKQRWGENYH